MKTQPTPGPWSVSENIDLRLPTDITARNGEDWIADCGMLNGLEAPESVANAEHIVRCVNAAPKAIAALEEAGKMVQRLANCGKFPGALIIGNKLQSVSLWAQECVDNVKAALAELKGE